LNVHDLIFDSPKYGQISLFSINATPTNLGRPKGSRDSKPRQKKQSKIQSSFVPLVPPPSSAAAIGDMDPIADHALVQIDSTIQTALQLFESDFDAEAAYSIEDDPFHYDWVFW
jgi:hypothetical protein